MQSIVRQTVLVILITATGWHAPAAWAEPRTAKVAGQFYPADPVELRQAVTSLLNRQPAQVSQAKPRVLIVPHAGYPYSGPVAAAGFRQLQGHAYDGVVVVGFTHRGVFAGASVDTREGYETPLGTILIDQEAVAFLLTYPGLSHLEEAHESGEHSLEVELPFLQAALPGVKLVPILLGSPRLEDARQLAEALAGLAAKGDYLFVFSTDLSHYHPYDEATAIDEGTVGAILSETPPAVHRLFERGRLEACGRGPIVAGLLLGDALGYLRRELLRYANSGDTTGDRSKVVGYAAIGMFERPPASGNLLSVEAGAALVQAARRTLQHALGQEGSGPPAELSGYPELSRARGLFVTLRTHGELRGCIGRIQTEEPLADTLPAVALEAALRDPRFPPVTEAELPELHVEVSVLTPPTVLANLNDLVPGRDGVVLESGGHSGVFLPQVWEETGWTRLEFLRELASQKAGLPPDAWRQATLRVFQDQIFEEPRPLVGASSTAH